MSDQPKYDRMLYMQIQHKAWAYGWIEAGLTRVESALGYLYYLRDLYMAWEYTKQAARCFYWAARRFWQARRFSSNEMQAGSARAVLYASFLLIDELSHMLHLDGTLWGFRFCQWCHRHD
jgi:hypothetical protein